MDSSKQNPAANEAHRVREIDQAGQRVDREYKETAGAAQRLIACVAKSGRGEFRIALKNYSDGTTKVEIRIFERKHDGWSETPRHIVVDRAAIVGIISALSEAEARL